MIGWVNVVPEHRIWGQCCRSALLYSPQRAPENRGQQYLDVKPMDLDSPGFQETTCAKNHAESDLDKNILGYGLVNLKFTPSLIGQSSHHLPNTWQI